MVRRSGRAHHRPMSTEDPRSEGTDASTTSPASGTGAAGQPTGGAGQAGAAEAQSTAGQAGAAGAQSSGAGGQQTATVSPPEALPQRRLVRLPDGAPGAGVAAGLGAYFSVDPVLFRLGFVVLAFAGGVGLILYLACWIAMPAGGLNDLTGPPPASPEGTSQWLAIGLAVFIGVLLLFQLPTGAPWAGWGVPLLWAVALIILGVLLFRWDADRRERAGTTGVAGAPQPGAAGPGATYAAPTEQRYGPAGQSHPPAGQPYGAAPSAETPTRPPWSGGGATAPPAPPAYGPPPPPAPPQPPSILGRLAMGFGLLALGLAALLDNVGVLALTPVHYVALALTISGLALVVGAWWGRARGFIAVGLLLIPLLVVTSALDGFWGRGAEMGQRFHQPQTAADVAPEYHLFAGELRLDLTEVELSPGDEVAVEVGGFAGDLLVLVPDDVNVTASGRSSAGEVRLLDTVSGGLGVSRSRAIDLGPDAGSLEVDASLVFGRVQVVRPDDRLGAGGGPFGPRPEDASPPSERSNR
jgi:phage shock protein PspC (stress-responsive transcriptional regulator)